MSTIALHPAQTVGPIAKKKKKKKCSFLPFTAHSESIFHKFIKMSFGSLVAPRHCCFHADAPNLGSPRAGRFLNCHLNFPSWKVSFPPGSFAAWPYFNVLLAPHR